MALNAGEVEVVLKLRDELSAKLVMAKAQLKDVGATSGATGELVNSAGNKMQGAFVGTSLGAEKLFEKTILSDKAMQGHLGSSNNLTSSLKAFDGVLGSVGIHLGPEIKAIGELGSASGKSALGLGLITTAGLAIGVGIAAWKITRAAMEFFELDQKVEGAWKKMLGFKDVAAEVADYKLDQLAKASRIAGRDITDMGEAAKIIAGAFTTAADKSIDWAQKLSDAQKEVRGLSAATIAEIEVAQRQGATVEQLTNKYGISAAGLKELANSQKLAGQAADIHKKALDEQKASIEKINLDYAKRIDLAIHAAKVEDLEAAASARATETLNKKNAAFSGWLTVQVGVKKAVDDAAAADRAYMAEQDALNAATDALSFTFVKAASAIDAEFGGALDRVGAKVAAASLSWSEAMAAVNAGLGTMTGTVQAPMTNAQWKKAADDAGGQVHLDSFGNKYIHVPGQNAPGTRAPGFKDGGPTKEGPAYLHDGEYVVPKGGALVQGGGGGGKTMTVQLVMSDGRELARAVVPWFPGELRRIGVA